jgi:hypothetical protein
MLRIDGVILARAGDGPWKLPRTDATHGVPVMQSAPEHGARTRSAAVKPQMYGRGTAALPVCIRMAQGNDQQVSYTAQDMHYNWHVYPAAQHAGPHWAPQARGHGTRHTRHSTHGPAAQLVACSATGWQLQLAAGYVTHTVVDTP